MALFPASMRSWRVWQRHRDVFLKHWKTDGIPLTLEPFMILVLMGLGIGTVVDDMGGVGYFEFLGPGLLASYVMFAPTFESTFNAYIRMAVRRLYDAIIVTPLSIEDVITGEILWGTTRAVLMAIIVLVVLTPLGLVGSPWAVLVLPMAALQGFLFASMSICYASIAPSVNSLNFFFSLFIYPMFFVSGVFFPVEQLPPAIQRLAWTLPLTPAVHVTRSLFTGEILPSVFWSVAGLTIASLAFYLLALRLMRRRLIR